MFVESVKVIIEILLPILEKHLKIPATQQDALHLFSLFFQRFGSSISSQHEKILSLLLQQHNSTSVNVKRLALEVLYILIYTYFLLLGYFIFICWPFSGINSIYNC
jgi:hypothetical protein